MVLREHALSLPNNLSMPQRFLPPLSALFIGSGRSALIYEVVRLQSLQPVLGSFAISLGVPLEISMGGLIFSNV